MCSMDFSCQIGLPECPPLDQQAGAAYVKLAEWLENALTARENRHLQSAAEAEKWADLPACECI